MDDIKILRRMITVDEFVEMRQAVGWGYPSKEAIYIGLNNTLFSVCVEREDEVIGIGRLIGDGGFAFYVQDIIVKPKFQRLSIGTKIMDEIMRYIKDNFESGSMVCLLSAKGKEEFYKKFGFIERPNDIYGAGMIQYVNK